MEVTGLCFAVVAIRGTASWNCWFVVSWRHIFSIAFVYLLLISVLEFKRRKGGRFSSVDSHTNGFFLFFFCIYQLSPPGVSFLSCVLLCPFPVCLVCKMHLAVAWAGRPTDWPIDWPALGFGDTDVLRVSRPRQFGFRTPRDRFATRKKKT